MKNNSKRTKISNKTQKNATQIKPKKEFLKLSSAMVEFKMRRNYRNFSK